MSTSPDSTEPVEIIELPTRVVVGEPVAAPFDRLHVEVPAAWRRLSASGAAAGARLAEASFTTHLGYVEIVGVLRDADDLAVPHGHIPVLVPAGRYARLVHDGPVASIADGFARIFAWADSHGIALGGRKLDVGYEADGPHELYIEVLGGSEQPTLGE